MEIIVNSRNFNKEEIAVAIELLDETLQRGETSGYIHVVLEVKKTNPTVQGYACYGPTPLTEGVYDLYWIAIDPDSQGRGLGDHLMKYVEQDVIHRKGRMIVVETSSQESYAAAKRFYKKNGYKRAARIKDFYRIGDDKLVYTKELK